MDDALEGIGFWGAATESVGHRRMEHYGRAKRRLGHVFPDTQTSRLARSLPTTPGQLAEPLYPELKNRNWNRQEGGRYVDCPHAE